MRFKILCFVLLIVVSLGVAAVARSSPQQQAAPAQNAAQVVALADEVAKDVEALRGWTFKSPVKKELTTVPELMQYLQRQVDKALPPGKDRVIQAFLGTIGLVPRDLDLKKKFLELLENQVGGFYDTDTKSMHLIARAGLPPVVERIVLAHELTHALDDQYVDLDTFIEKRMKGTEDLDLTGSSVVEGSATALMLQYLTREMMRGTLSMNQLQDYAKQEEERSKAFLQAPRYFTAMLGSYICGTQFLAKGRLASLVTMPDDRPIGEALAAAVKDPPLSTEQILHPEKYWDAAHRDVPVVFDDKAADKWMAQPGRWVVHADTIGEMLTAILTSPAGFRPDLSSLGGMLNWTNASATGWGGDRFYLLAAGQDADAARRTLTGLKGVWLTAWDTTADRDEFVAAVPQGSLAPGASVQPIGDSSAVVYFGFEETERTALSKKLAEAGLVIRK